MPFEVNYQFHSLADLWIVELRSSSSLPEFASHLEKTQTARDMPLCAPFLYKEGRKLRGS